MVFGACFGCFESNAKGQLDGLHAYELGRELGKGQYGVVRLCTHLQTGTQYAMKALNGDKVTKQVPQERVLKEIAIMEKLHHPNIVGLHKTFHENDTTYLVMEFVGGGELMDHLVREGHFSEKRTRDTIRCLARALSYMHANNVCHRDLKPENLLCTENNHIVKISDFGLAEHFETGQSMTQRAGTPTYVAPEVLRGEGYGNECDLWSLGVILYILLCGYPPFYEDDLQDLFRAIIEGDFEFHESDWDDKSELAKDLVRKLLVVEPHRRLTANEVLAHPWIGDKWVSDKHMRRSYDNFKSYNAKRKLKKVTQGIRAVERLRGLRKVKLAAVAEESAQSSS